MTPRPFPPDPRTDPYYGPNDRRVAAEIQRLASAGYRGSTTATVEQIAGQLELSDRTVTRALRKLEDGAAIWIIPDPGGPSGRKIVPAWLRAQGPPEG